MLIVNMATTWPVIMCLYACDSMLHMQCSWSKPLAGGCIYVSVCVLNVCQLCTLWVMCVQINTAGAACSCATVFFFFCCFFFFSKSRTLSERPQADAVDAYLWQTGLTLHTGCLQISLSCAHTHTHTTEKEKYSIIYVLQNCADHLIIK